LPPTGWPPTCGPPTFASTAGGTTGACHHSQLQ
jgi:hypothetical protein